MQNLEFSSLLVDAISQWPEKMDLVLVNETDELQRYAVVGLGKLADSISDAYIDHHQEVIYRNLHWSINIVIHGVAKYTNYLNLSQLRSKAIQIHFESTLRKIQESEDEWPKAAQDLIRMYFEKNSKVM